MDITADRDLARIHHILDAIEPDMLVIGPLYRLVPRALQTDDEAAPVLTALDTIRARGVALLIEAHAGHGIGRHGVRDLRPRGSSALLGWPEFGFGMRGRDDGTCDLVPWRGERDEREWPRHLRQHETTMRWIPAEATP
jgi:replicative DNA helicase